MLHNFLALGRPPHHHKHEIMGSKKHEKAPRNFLDISCRHISYAFRRLNPVKLYQYHTTFLLLIVSAFHYKSVLVFFFLTKEAHMY